MADKRPQLSAGSLPDGHLTALTRWFTGVICNLPTVSTELSRGTVTPRQATGCGPQTSASILRRAAPQLGRSLNRRNLRWQIAGVNPTAYQASQLKARRLYEGETVKPRVLSWLRILQWIRGKCRSYQLLRGPSSQDQQDLFVIYLTPQDP